MTTTMNRKAATTFETSAPEQKLTKAQKRAQALADYRKADDVAKVASANKNALKDAALALCDDLKTYKDVDGHSYSINKETEATDYSGTLKWALAPTNPLGLDKGQLKSLAVKLDASKSSKKNSAPIKRND